MEIWEQNRCCTVAQNFSRHCVLTTLVTATSITAAAPWVKYTAQSCGHQWGNVSSLRQLLPVWWTHLTLLTKRKKVFLECCWCNLGNIPASEVQHTESTGSCWVDPQRHCDWTATFIYFQQHPESQPELHPERTAIYSVRHSCCTDLSWQFVGGRSRFSQNQRIVHCLL